MPFSVSCLGFRLVIPALMAFAPLARAQTTITNNGTLNYTSAVTVGSSGLEITGSGANGTLSGALFGIGPLSKTGTGTWTLSGYNFNFAGPIYVNEGTLVADTTVAEPIGHASPLYVFGALGIRANTTFDLGSTRLLTVASGAVLDTPAGSTLTISGSMGAFITDEGATWTKTGSGTVALTGATARDLGVIITAGTLQLRGDKNSSSRPIVFDGSATLALDGVSLLNTSLQFNTGGTVSVATGTTVVDSFYALSGSGTLTKAGNGMLVLSAGQDNSQFTGAIVVSGGTLAVSGDSTLGAVPGTATPTALTLNGGTLLANTATTLHVNRGLALGSQATLSSGTSSLEIAGVITGAGTQLDILGSGTVTLSGANTYSGTTTLTSGTLVLGGNTALGPGLLKLNGGTLQAGGGALTVTNPYTLTAHSGFSGGDTLTLSGGGTLAGFHSLTVAAGTTARLTGTIGESSPSILIKQGAGLLELTCANTFTGGAFISSGTVRINNSTGSAFGTGAVTVANGATLTGAGSFPGAFQNNGTYAPGNSPALSVLSTFSQGSTGLLLLELGGLDRGTGYDALDITGSASFAGTLEVTFYDNFTVTGGESFNLFDWGSLTGTFDTLLLPTLAGGLAWDTAGLYTSGVLSVSGSAVPEPATYAALAGALALGVAGWRRRSRS